MNVEQRVFNKLFKDSKTELATQKIDLATIDDLNKRKGKFIQNSDDISKLINQVDKIKTKFKSQFKQLSKEYDKLQNDYEELFDKASDIGAKDLASKAFQSKNQLANKFGNGWDDGVLRFLQK